MCFFKKEKRTKGPVHKFFGRGQAAIREEGGFSAVCRASMIAFYFYFFSPEQLQMMNAG
jgi:hypothetical protein